MKQLKSKQRIDVAGGYTPGAFEVIEQAYLLADKLNHPFVTIKHLFYSSLADPQVAAVFSRLNIDSKRLFTMLKDHIGRLHTGEDRTRLSREVKEVLVEAIRTVC